MARTSKMTYAAALAATEKAFRNVSSSEMQATLAMMGYGKKQSKKKEKKETL